jgi:hypothetical protein
MNDLEQATTDELIDELYKRFPTMIFAGMREAPGDTDADQRLLIHKGNVFTNLGMAVVACGALRRRIRQVEIDAEDMDDE